MDTKDENRFDPTLHTHPPQDDGVELFTDESSNELGAALANLMNETWDALGQVLDGAEVTVVAVKYALPAGKLNPILKEYLRDYQDNIDIIAHIYGETHADGESGLGAEVEYYYQGEPFNPTIYTRKEFAAMDVAEPVPMINHMPSPVDIMQACIDQDTSEPKLFVDIPGTAEDAEEEDPDDEESAAESEQEN